MEADSTTYDNNSKDLLDVPSFPFNTCPGNYRLYQEFMSNGSDKSLEAHLVSKLQEYGLLPRSLKCPSNKDDCKVICKTARVVDRVQWSCESCGKRQPIREGSFFLRLQCTMPQVMQMMLAWCEDADCEVAGEYFGVKSKVANQIYDKLDELAIKEYNTLKLGGHNVVVLAEMYPNCLTRLSPDTTDQPHVHRILMLADTKHIPTRYRLHIIKEDPKKINNSDEMLKSQIQEIISTCVLEGSTIVTGTTSPAIDGAVTIQQLAQHCDADMQHFLSTRIWRHAVTICSASRELCISSPLAAACAGAVSRYLRAALGRRRLGPQLYRRVLRRVASECTAGNEQS